jgi:transposase
MAIQRPTLPPDERARETIRHWARSGTLPHRLVVRARIVQLGLEGLGANDTARELGVSTRTVALWLQRFQSGGPEALRSDASGRGRHSRLAEDDVQGLRAQAAAGRSLRSLAASLGVSKSTVHRALKRSP